MRDTALFIFRKLRCAAIQQRKEIPTTISSLREWATTMLYTLILGTLMFLRFDIFKKESRH